MKYLYYRIQKKQQDLGKI